MRMQVQIMGPSTGKKLTGPSMVTKLMMLTKIV
jgi:hypothetical protein